MFTQGDAAPDPNGPATLSDSDRRALASSVADAHRKGLAARRFRDLTCEKYLLHIDGEGDNQWADILHGQQVAIPRLLSEYRCQENLLRPIVDNMIAYHCTMPFRFVAETKADRESRERARIDAALANYIANNQRLNQTFAEAKFMAAASGFCPVHAYWRDDLSFDPYEPMYGQGVRRGMIDAWVGNPFDTTFNAGAKRGSVQSATYGRVVPAEIVRQAFGNVLKTKLEGTNKMPSASIFQRIARKWVHVGTNIHGTAALSSAENGAEELIALICREIAPGVDPKHPNGRLTIVALQGSADTNARTGSGEAILLADQPLPAGRFSFVNVYSHHRFDDVLGKPFVGDLDQKQVELNLGLSSRREYIERSLKAPTIMNGRLVDDTAEYDGYTLLEMEPGSQGSPKTLELPSSPVTLLNTHIQEIRQAMYTLGGYQASSRGEMQSGTPYRALVAMQQADDTIHGPTNLVFRDTVCDFMQLCWSLMKEYGDVPWVIDAVGDDYAHLGQLYVDNTKISESCPTFRLVSSAGTPEVRDQQLLNLVQMTDPAGAPILTAQEFRKRWSDQSLIDEESDPVVVQKRRARTVTAKIRELTKAYRTQTGFPNNEMGDPWVQQAAQMVFQQVEQKYPRMRDDDLNSHLAALSEITQDETEDAIARWSASYRQDLYYEWQQQMSQQPAAQQGVAEPRKVQKPDEGSSLDPENIAAEVHGKGAA